MESCNVIGQINGTNSSDKVNIVCAHYDCWWNQGAIDEALETALVLGIAGYMKENNITPIYDTKFIAFAGEELGFRGAKDYLLKHYGKEKVVNIINPGNFGHNDKTSEPKKNRFHFSIARPPKRNKTGYLERIGGEHT